MRGGDVVLHKPSGETWLVCGVDPERDLLIPCGYPFPTMGRMSDCEVITAADGQPEEYKEVLRKYGFPRFIEE